jgi:hypothetical protein
MNGSRFPGLRVIVLDHLPRDLSIPSGINGRRLSAYSCGGSRGIAGPSQRTAFPWLALAGTTDINVAPGRDCVNLESFGLSADRRCVIDRLQKFDIVSALWKSPPFWVMQPSGRLGL